jgi:GT2 family glycosyltransferase
MRVVTVTVVVPSFRRPEQLARALPAVIDQVRELGADDGFEASVLVVDNDSSGSATAVVRHLGSPLVRYVIEPAPGISAARNRGLDETSTADALVFIDDDESPRPAWLRSLVDTWRETGATAVMGRVISEYVSEPDAWVAAGQFFRRPSRVTGTRIPVAAAGNLLLDVAQVRELGLRFDDRFGLSGGEDTLFSRQLVARGGTIVWCEESVATDYVPAARATREWVLGRARRSGNTATLVDLCMAGSASARLGVRAGAIVGGLARAGAGGARYLAGLAAGSAWHQARGLRTANRGIGMMSAAVGTSVQEYARDEVAVS